MNKVTNDQFLRELRAGTIGRENLGFCSGNAYTIELPCPKALLEYGVEGRGVRCAVHNPPGNGWLHCVFSGEGTPLARECVYDGVTAFVRTYNKWMRLAIKRWETIGGNNND